MVLRVPSRALAGAHGFTDANPEYLYKKCTDFYSKELINPRGRPVFLCLRKVAGLGFFAGSGGYPS
jgi:hypothetical protein